MSSVWIILCGKWAEGKGVLWNRAGPDKICYVGVKPKIGRLIYPKEMIPCLTAIYIQFPKDWPR